MNAYKQAIKEEMEELAKLPKAIFLGQQVGAQDFYGSLADIKKEQRIEMPVAEELQMGMSIGMALEGYLPISIYQRMDFLPRACDQLVNHLDILKELSCGKFNPKVIIRSTVGTTNPLDVGLQHKKDLVAGFKAMLKYIEVYTVKTPTEVHEVYQIARTIQKPIMVIEYQDLYT